jgi:transcriptional regulator with XRE-family HTH domain
MTEELSISVSEREAEERSPDLPGASVGRPCDVGKLRIPVDSALFADEEFRKGFCSSHLLGFLPSQLRTLRKSEGLSQKDLAKKLNTQQSAVSRLEKVDNGSLNIGTAIEIGEALDRPFIAYWGYYSELLGHVARSEQAPQAFLATAAYRDDPGFFPWKPPVPSAESELVRAVQKALFQWLDTPSPDCEALMRFLQGYDLPPVSDTLPPYHWLLLAIREWGLAGGARENFFAAVGGCLDRLGAAVTQRDNVEWDQWVPLFHLCAQLADPARLAKPLYRLFQLLGKAESDGALEVPLDPRVAFGSALLKNPDARLAPVLGPIGGQPRALFAKPSELAEATVRCAHYGLIQRPAAFVESAAMRIYGFQFDETRDPGLRKSTFQERTQRALDETLLKDAAAGDLPYHAIALLFWGGNRYKWVSTTFWWTREVLNDQSAQVRRAIESCWQERGFVTAKIPDLSPVELS